MEKELDIVVEADGTIRFIHDDDVAELFADEETTTKRASHVEPVTENRFGGWVADMRPSDGPMIFSNCESWSERGEDVIGYRVGFKTRRAALDAEIAWLQKERGL